MPKRPIRLFWDDERATFLTEAEGSEIVGEGKTPAEAFASIGARLRDAAAALKGAEFFSAETLADAPPAASRRKAPDAAPPGEPLPKDAPRVLVYTDGACDPNPGTGGWGAILITEKDGKTKRISGGEAETTNNRMELTAAVSALESLRRPCRVRLHTDSQYLRNAFAKGWLANWRRNGWRTADKRPVANRDLWERLDELASVHSVEWLWVRGHAGDPLNEECDRLAVEARGKVAARPKT